MAVDVLAKNTDLVGFAIPEEERFRLLVESVTDYAIYLLDPAGHIASWNVGAERAKGYQRHEIIGEHFSRFYPPEDREAGEPENALDIARREGRYEKEAQRVRKDGSRFLANVVIEAIRDERGELIGFAKTTRDVTERAETEKELAKARDALFQAQKIEALGQLTGGIAHDFNNLLMAVLSSLEMLRKRIPGDPKLVQLLENAVQGAERGAALTQRMLAFARKQDLRPTPLNIPILIGGLKGQLEGTLGPSIQVITHVRGNVRPAFADANQLELAILNLAVNARDAMPEGGSITFDVREDVAAKTVDGVAAGAYVCVSITDTGEGMEAETLARATEPFFTTKGVGRGTGLGLSMVYGFAEQMSGRLTLSSRKGEGTTAVLWIPVASTDAVSAPPAELKTEARTPGTRPLVVLAVDDDALVLMNTTAMLEDLGHKVLEASNGHEALDVLRANADIDIVITDFAMPRMTGRDLAVAIARERPGLPVVLATGYAELPTGADVDARRLPKPFGQTELARAIADVRKS